MKENFKEGLRVGFKRSLKRALERALRRTLRLKRKHLKKIYSEEEESEPCPLGACFWDEGPK